MPKKTRRVAAATLVRSILAFALLAVAAGTESAGPATAPTTVATAEEGRGHFKKMMMSPYMLIPQLIALGFAPIVLANLKMMVMSALMINNMALNAAIIMTVRNLVFGPRPVVKYANHGYSRPPPQHDRYQQEQLGQQEQQGDIGGQGERQQELLPSWSDETVTSDRRRRRKRRTVS